MHQFYSHFSEYEPSIPYRKREDSIEDCVSTRFGRNEARGDIMHMYTTPGGKRLPRRQHIQFQPGRLELNLLAPSQSLAVWGPARDVLLALR